MTTLDALALVFTETVCGRGHSTFKCPFDCLGHAQHLLRARRDELLADDEPMEPSDA
jgi:hypothetical protein